MKPFLQILLMSVALCSCGNKDKTSGAMINRSLDELKSVLNTGHKWEKVHAAEFLLELGHNENVYDVFYSELQKNGHEPQYRIGIWRVLYRSSNEDEKQKWSESIYNVFIDPSAPDRIHAAETLAKLKIAKHDRDSSVIDSTMSSDVSPLWFYTHWWIVPQLENGLEELKYFLFDILKSDQYDASIRSLASYVIHGDKSILLSETEWQTLRSIVVSEPTNSNARALLSVAAFSKAPAAIPEVQLVDIKNILFNYKDSNTYQFCLAYAERGNLDDIDMLSQLFENEDADIKNAVAYAILRINQRSNKISK